ncbi:MAG: hypothetical protein WCQ72_08280 [Eubacteriales bacterium]
MIQSILYKNPREYENADEKLAFDLMLENIFTPSISDEKNGVIFCVF